jgi:DNA-binding CsgD family transcriptional regulator
VEGAALARQALQLARRPDAEPSWETEAAYRLVRCGALAEGEAVLQRKLAAAAVAGDWTLVARCASVLSEVVVTCGDIDLAIGYHHQSLAAIARLGRTDWAIEVGLTLLLACRGDLAEAQQHLDRLLAGDVPIATEFAQLPAAWIELELGDLERVGERIARMRPVRSLGVATFTMAVLLIQARWRHRLGDAHGALAALDEADTVSGDPFEPGRPDRLILRARVASQLGDVAMISAVGREFDELVERGGGVLTRAGAEWAHGLWAQHAGQRREARRRLQAAAELCEQASRFVMAVEAWSDLAATSATDDQPDVRARAIERADQLANDRGFVALRARLHEIATAGSGEASWPAAFDTLTPRQRDIALLVAAGQTNRQIGERLYLSEHTVRNQLVNIFRTLGVTRRSELSALAARTSRSELKT